MLLTSGDRGKRIFKHLKPFMYRIKVVNKGKVGYQYKVNNIVADIVYSLFLFLVCIKFVFVFSIELIIDSKLVLV